MGDKPIVRVGHLKITDHLILGITKHNLEQGAETFQRSTLELVPKTGWNEVADALTGGEINAACVLAPTAMDLFKRGLKIKLVLCTHKTGSVIISNKKANIKSAKDFKGKITLIPYQLSVHNMLLHEMLSKEGLTVGMGTAGADVGLEVMAPAMMPQAIEYDEEGEIGGYIVAEPFGSQAVAAGYGQEFALSKDLWPDHLCCVLVMNEELTEGRPDAALELVKSLVASGRFAEESPDEAAAIGASFLSQEKAVIKKVLTEPADRIKTGELMPVLEDLNTVQNYMADKMGIIKSKIDLEKFVDVRFAQEAGAK